jgi:hypothetical protein
MKREFVFIILLFCLFCIIPLNGQNTSVLTIEEEFSSITSQNPVIIGTESKQLRALDHAFGFGSNLNRYKKVLQYYNIFDTFLINSNNQKMSDFPVGTNLTNFATGDNVFWKTSTGYKMYAKSPFDRNITFIRNKKEYAMVEYPHF